MMIDTIQREATVTTKGQVTIPVDVRKVLGLRPEALLTAEHDTTVDKVLS